jgi:hypothetical protein
MTDELDPTKLDPYAPEYDAQHEQVDELAALAELDKLLTEANKLVIDFEVPEPRSEDSYPTVIQIEDELGPYPQDAK